MAKRNATLAVTFIPEYKGFIEKTEKKLKSLSDSIGKIDGLGLSDAAEKEINAIKKTLSSLGRELTKTMEGAMDSSEFVKAQESIIKRVNELETRTTTLEKSMSALMQTMSKSDGGKLNKELQEISQSMETITTVTKAAVSAVDQFTGASKLDNLKKLDKLLREVSNSEKEVASVDISNRSQGWVSLKLKKEAKEYFEILREVDDLQKKTNRNDDENHALVEKTKQLIKQGNIVKEMAEQAKAQFKDYGQSTLYDDVSVNSLTTPIETRLKKAKDFIVEWRNDVNAAITDIEKRSSAVDIAEKYDIKKNGISVPLNIATSSETLLRDVVEIVNVVNDGMKGNPILLQLELNTEWGKRDINKYLKQFQDQIDNLSPDADVSKLQELSDKLQKAFGKQLEITFSTNFLDVRDEVLQGLTLIREQLKGFAINPYAELNENQVEKIQKQLNAISKKLVLDINKIELTPKASEKIKAASSAKTKEAKETAQALETVLKTMETRFGGLDKNFENARKSIEAILNLLQAFPLENIVKSVSNLTMTLREAFNLGAIEDVEGVFDEIKKDVSEITGSLKTTKNKNAITDVLSRYQEYRNKGGIRGVEELGGEANVQKWLQKNAQQVETAGEKTGKAYAEGIKKKTPEVAESGQKLAKTVEESVADTQQSSSPSKIAEQLGHYWGDGYAEGILNSEAKVKNAIRALVEAGKITMSELITDDVHTMQSQDVYADIANGKGSKSKYLKENIQRIKDIDHYGYTSDTMRKTGFNAQSNDELREWTRESIEIDAAVAEAEKEKSKAVKETNKALKEQGEALSKLKTAEDKANKSKEESVQKTNKQKSATKELSKETTKSTQTQKTNQELSETKVKAEAAGDAIATNGEQAEEAAKGWEKAAKRANELSEALGALGKTTSPFDKKANIFKSLDRLANYKPSPETPEDDEKTKEERAKMMALSKSANAILKAHGKYTSTGDTKYLAEMLGESSKSSLRTGLKTKITNAVKKRLQEVDDGIQEGVKEATEQPQKKTQIKWLTAKEFKKYVTDNGIIAQGDEFDYNYKNKINAMQNRGEAKKENGRWKYAIKVEVEDENQSLEKTTKNVTKLDNAVDELDEKFMKLKEFVKLYGSGANGAGPGLWAEQYRRYTENGGTRPLSDLTDDKKVLKDIQAEYKKLTSSQEENSKSKKSNAKASKEASNAAEKEAATEKKAQQATKETAKAKTDAQKASAKASQEAAKSAKKQAEAEKEVQKETKKTTQTKKEADKASKKDTSSDKKVKQAKEEVKAEQEVAAKKKETSKATEQAASQEKKSFNDVEESVNGVTEAVNKMTDSIKENKKEVSDAVSQEKQKFSELKDSINEVSSSSTGKGKKSSTSKASSSKAEKEYDDALMKQRAKVIKAKADARKLELVENGILVSATDAQDSYGNIVESVIEWCEYFEDETGRLVKATRHEKFNFDKNGKFKYGSALDEYDYSFDEKLRQADEKTRLAVQKNIEKTAEEYDRLQNKVKEAKSELLKFNNALNNNGITEYDDDLKALAQQLDKVTNNADMSNFRTSFKLVKDQISEDLDDQKMLNAMAEANAKTQQKRAAEEERLTRIQEKAIENAREEEWLEEQRLDKIKQSIIAGNKRRESQLNTYLAKDLDEESYKELQNLYDKLKTVDSRESLTEYKELLGIFTNNLKTRQTLAKEDQKNLKEQQRIDAERVRNDKEVSKTRKALVKAERDARSLELKKQGKRNELDNLKKNTFDGKTLQEINKLYDTLNKVQDAQDFSDYVELFRQFDKNLKERQRVADLEAKSAREVAQEAEKASEYKLKVEAQNRGKTEKRLNALVKGAGELNAEDYMPQLRARIEALQQELINNPIDPISQDAIDRIQKAENELRDIQNLTKDKSQRAASSQSIEGLYAKVANFMDANTAMSSKFKTELQGIIDKLRSGVPIAAEELNKLDTQFRRIQGDVKALGQTGNSLFASIRKQLRSANAQFIATYLSIHDIIRYVREAARAVTELDSALTELRKVSDASTSRLAQSFEKSAQTAQELGSTISHVINVTSDWARLGYDVDAAEELARVTTLFTTVGDNMSADDASGYLISTLQGFQIGADRAEEIVDKYNEVANNFAIDTRGIGEALQRSAASFYAANTDLSKSIALVTTANAVVQNPESVGTLWKTMSARIRGAKTELEELGEEEDEFTKTTSKLRNLVMGLTGFDIMEDEDTFKDIYDIIVGIGKEWKNLTDIERASLGEALAGKRNVNGLFATLNNIEMLEAAYKKAEESSGSAAKEQQNYAKSVQYSIDRAKASLEELAYDFMSSGFLKGVIEAFNSFLQVLDSAIEKFGVLGTLLPTIGAGAVLVNLKKIVSFFREMSDIGKATESIAKLMDAQSWFSYVGMGFGDQVKYLKEELIGLSEAGKIATVSSMGLNEEQAILLLTEAGVSDEAIAQSLANGKLAVSQRTLEKSTFSVTTAMKTFWKTTLAPILSNPFTWIVAALGAVAVAAYKTNQANKELRKSAEKLSESYSNAKNDINGYKDEVSELQKILSNSSTSYEDARNARKRLMEIQDELIGKYGDEREAIDLITEGLDGNIEAFDKLTERQWQATKSEFNNQNLKGWDWANRKSHGADDNIGVMLDEFENLGLTISGVRKDFTAIQGLTKELGDDLKWDDEAQAFILHANNANEMYQKLVDIRGLLEDQDADAQTIRTLDKQIAKISELQDSYGAFYDQYVLHERVLNPDYSFGDNYQEWIKLYDEYYENVASGNKELADENIQEFKRQYEALQVELSTSNMSEAAKNSVLDTFRNMYPQIDAELTKLEEHIVDVERRGFAGLVTGSIDTSKSYGDALVKEITEYVDKLDPEDFKVLIATEFDWKTLDPKGFIAKCEELLKAAGEVPVEIKPHKSADKVLDKLEFKDPDDDSKTIKGAEKLNNYYSTLADIHDAIQKLNSGSLSSAEISDLAVKYDLASHSIKGMTEELENYIRTEEFAAQKMIDEILNDPEYANDSGLISTLKNVKQLIHDSAEEALSLKTNLVGGAKAINDVQNLKAGMDMIGSIYKDVQDGEEFDWSSIINNAEFESTFKSCGQVYDDFLTVIEKSPKDIKAAQDAFDNLVTEFYYSNIGNFADATEEEINAITTMLKQMGVVNADEVVKAQIEIENARKEMEKAGDEAQRMLASLSGEDIDFDLGIEKATDNLDKEFQKIQDLELGDYAEDIKNKTIQSVFGNVDMDKRTIIRWSEEMKQTYKDALDSWQYDPDVGGIDTVFGGSDTFKLDGEEIEVAFTPILVDQYGMNPQFLTSDTVKNYIQKVLEQADKEISESEQEWSEEAVIKRAFEIDLEGMNTEEINSQGEVIGETFVQGIIAGIGDESIDIGKLLHFSGEKGAIEIAEETLSSYNSLKEKIASNTLSLENVTAGEIAVLEQEGVITSESAQEMAELALQKQLTNAAQIDTSQDAADLLALATQGQSTATVLEALKRVMDLLSRKEEAVQDYIRTGEKIHLVKAEYFDRQIDEQMSIIRDAVNNQSEVEPVEVNIEPKADTKGAGGAGKEAGDAYVDAFNKELEKLKKAYERGDISLKDYLSQWKALIKKFFADNPKYAEEYANQMKSYLDGVKGYFSSAISGVGTILQGRIGKLQKEKDKAVKALEKEKEAALAGYQAQIDAIDKTIKAKNKQIKQLEKEKKAIDKTIKSIQNQIKVQEKLKKEIEGKIKPLEDEIDAIQKANEERKKELDLQKDLYEQERLQNQRTQFIYKDNQMVYQADPSAARDAREKVKEDEDQKKIDAIQKQIDAYNEEIEEIEKIIENYNEQIEALEEQKELIDEQIEAINEEIEALEEEKEAIEETMKEIEEYYDKLIKETEEMFDEMIEGLEEVLEKWQRLSEMETIANAWKDVGQVMEIFGYSVEDVLNDAPGAFDTFEAAWIGVLGNMSGENEHFIQGLADASGKTVEEVKALMAQVEDFGQSATKPVEEAGTAIENVGSKAGAATGNVSTFASGMQEAADASDKLAESTAKIGDATNLTPLQTELNTLKQNIEEVARAIEGGEEGSIKAALDSLAQNTDLSTLITQFEDLATAISSAASALGVGGGALPTNGGIGGSGAQSSSTAQMYGAEGATGSLISALQELDGIELTNVITQFDNLKTAIEGVTAALGGGGGEASGEGMGSGTGKGSGSGEGSGEGEEGGGTLISAIEAVKEATDENIGSEDSEEGDTVIGSFRSLETAVGDVSTAIGTSESDDSSADLIGSISSLGKKNKEVLKGGGEGGGGVISDWEEFNTELTEAASSITDMVESLDSLKDSYETELTVKLTIEGGGMFTGTATMGKTKGNFSLNVLDAIGLPSSGGSWKSDLKHHAKGTATLKGKSNLFGDWAYDGGKTLIAELGPELVVFPDGHFETYDKPQMVNLPKGSVIFNHLQTEDILDKKNQISSRGKSNANGSGIMPLSGDSLNQMINLANAISGDTSIMKADLGGIKRHTEEISRTIQNTTNNTQTTNISFGDMNFTCNGVSAPEVMSEVQNALNRTFEGMALNAYQKAMAH